MIHENLIFNKTDFFDQLLKYRAMKEPDRERYFNNDGKVLRATALRLLDGSVYRPSFATEIDVEKLNQYPRYKELLGNWKKWNVKTDTHRKKYITVKSYSLEPLYNESIRANCCDKLDRFPNLKFSLEFVISFCLACGVENPQYIYDAVEALCEDQLDGKGMRKILLQGAVFRCWDFGDIAYNGVKTGLMESYFEKFLTNASNQPVIDFLTNEISGEKSAPIPAEIIIGTRTFQEMVSQCRCAKDFIYLLDDPKIQCGALYDLVDTTYYVKDYIAKHEKDLPSRASVYAYNFVPKASYNSFVHGRCNNPFFFLKLACMFGFDQEEIRSMINSFHLNIENVYGLATCVSGTKEICQFERNSDEYKTACTKLMDQICKEYNCNSAGEPTNTDLKSFFSFLDKLRNYTESQNA